MAQERPRVEVRGRRLAWPFRGRPGPAFLLGALLGIAVVAVGGALIGGPLALAHRTNLPLELAYGNGAVGLAARIGAASVPTPAPSGGRGRSGGSVAFAGSCSVCHGANGDGRGIYGQATYPPATNLTVHDAVEKSDSELFWIIKNGLSFTGMPSFGSQYSDQDIWALVAYIRTLQKPGQPSGATSGEGGGASVNPAGSAAQRGAAVFVAQGCAACHSVGGSGGLLPLRGGGGESSQAVRRGRPGMPAYSTSQLTDAELADLNAYLSSGGSGFAGRGGD